MRLWNVPGYNECARFDSVQEWAHCEPSPANQKHPASRMHRERSWYGELGSLDQARALVTRGWPEGLAQMRRTIGALSVPDARSVMRRSAWSDQGDDVDIGRIWSGELDRAWRTTRRVAGGTGRRIIRLRILQSILGRGRQDGFFWRGAIATTLADALESAGYRVEILAYTHTTNLCQEGHRQYIEIPIKAADEPLDLDRLAAMTGHIGIFRTLGFRGKLNVSQRRCRSNMGYTDESPPPGMEEGDFTIRNVPDKQAALDFVAKFLQNFE